jgi:nitroreductase
MIDAASADLLLTTTRSVRRRLDFERAVPRDLVDECLTVAMQAPTGGNLQSWHFIVVTDNATRQTIGALYKDAWERYIATAPYEFPADDPRGQRFPFVVASAQYLADEMARVPVLVVPCISPRVEGTPFFMTATVLASVLPAMWSFMLAARSRGLGTTLTTLSLMHDREVSELLGIPDDYTHCGLIPVAYYTGDSFSPTQRLPLAMTVSYDTWGEAAPV